MERAEGLFEIRRSSLTDVKQIEKLRIHFNSGDRRKTSLVTLIVEDTDDLTPLINDQSKLLQKTYGDYYVSELVEAQDDNLKCVVVEYDCRAVGFVSATRSLNLRNLNSHYDLDLFNGLAKLDKPMKEETGEKNEFPTTVTGSTLKVTGIGIVPSSIFMDMLPLLFSQFPDLEYAVITVPRLVKCFPMLKSFVHCRIKQNKDPEHELYVFHRCELHRDFTVRRTRHADEEDIKLLVRNMNAFDRSLFLSDLQSFISNGRDEDGTIIFSYVAIALGKLVGVAILRDEHHIEWLRAHYNIEDFIYFTHHARNEHVSLYHFLLAANFQSRTELFLREILRQSKKTCIYYCVLPPYADKSKFSRCTLITCLSKLSPVKPRKQIIYPESLLNNIKAPEKRILEKFDSMPALFMTTAKLLMEPKEIINARIIIVGASTTGLAVLEKLVTCPYVRFTNLVLLSTNGLPGDTLERINPLAYKFLSTDYAYPVDYLSQLGFKVCVNVIHGKLTAIDRKFKRITISSEQKISYDYLIITTGLQYHVSCPISKLENLTKDETNNNLISMNFYYNHDEDNNSYNEKTVNKLFIVYGYTIDAYTCITGLLNAGIDGNRIIMIQPPEMKHYPPAFNSSVIQRQIHKHMNKLKIRIGYDFILDHWCNSNMESSSFDIETVTFNSDGKFLTIPCLGLFYFHVKTVDVDVFKALNDSCIVFDSRLVIDSNFHTNDSSIFAAGPITKLKRIYYNDYWRHEIANSMEIGHCLGDQLLNLFDPNIENVKAPPVDDSFILPTFKQSKTVGALLPGNLFYLHCTQPSLCESMNIRTNNSEFGRLLVTGEDAEEIQYFSIYINKYNIIQDITCLSTKEFPAENYIQLFNLHESLLNHLVSRFDEGLIHDFYDYFNDTWSLAIYHDRFTDFKSEIRSLINTCSPTTTNESLGEKLRTIIKEKDEV
ncbi:hypothetical protein Smp_146080 [Schistosoma mansoni]|uniref:hypothetical protein n=1 Tax=Schistosoma mansoni TaxID=6183 RepID=UPI0001A62EF4|nr:hypothetical protein Smp_146080 [Schistosoma mansoni]|eukprot:XP_018650503.1 hypothetical protein Smp_146080 [Schistosoma mansoni]